MGQARNISLLGHSGSGKTTLATSLLKKGGIKDQIAFDSSQEEKERGYSIDLGFGAYTYKGTTFTLIDTPGGDEFIEEMVKAVPVADLNLIVINGEKGVEVVTERAWELTGAAGRPTAVLINHLDKGIDFDKVLGELREHFEGGKFLVLQIPIIEGGKFVGVVDVLAGKAIYFGDKGKKDVPDALSAALEEHRGYLVEEISSIDDELMMKFLEEEEISTAELASTLSQGIAAGSLIPVFSASGLEEKGIDLLMDAFLNMVPAPAVDPSAPPRAVVFNLATDPYLGRLTYVRVLEGTIKEGSHLVELKGGNKVEIRDIYSFEGTKQKRVPAAEAGEIVAIGKLDNIELGVTLAASPDAEPFPMPAFPKPIFSRAIVPKSQADVEKMSSALKELGGTKATIRVERDPVTKELILWGMGDVHLSVFIERLKNRYNVSLETKQPEIPYKETIRKKATAKYRHKKQTGGRGQFGEVVLRIEPLPRGEGFKFVDEIKGAAIPGQYIPGVEKGVIEAMEEGNLAKYPVTDVLVAVFDGSFHPVDSSELAFKLAARNAFRAAYDQANPCLLEPIMALEVKVPEDFTGDIVSDLNGRRGRILGMEPAGGRTTVIKAEVPLAELQSYALDLKSLTQARGTFQMEFLKYQTVPANIQEKIVARAQKEGE
ncbi:elongation factor G [Candidatus Bipolaricaulota bacterium]|jgi:elongation factor G|nr:elongation factor G [Candidatus Bipolaricaulota bacterium]